MNGRGAVVAHKKDETVLYLALPGELLAQHAYSVIHTGEGSVHGGRVGAGLMSEAIHRRELGKDKPRTSCGGLEQVTRNGIIRGLVPHGDVRH
jgi:hypothetical protein